MIKQVLEKQCEQGIRLPLGLACQKALNKQIEYYNNIQLHAHSSITTICDLQFNFNVFNILMPTLADNAKIKLDFKTVFFKYQDQELSIKASRILRQNEDALEAQDVNGSNNNEQLDVELYRTSPLELDTKTEFT